MNYLGSKTKLLGFIDTVVTECQFKINKPADEIVFCDLFSGSGKVANHFKDRFKVVANDLEYYSYATLCNLLNNDSSTAYECKPILDYMNYCMDGEQGFIYQNYSEDGGRTYFTNDNAKKIDAGISLVYRLYNEKELTEQQFYYCLCSVLEGADKVSNTTGLYTAYLKEFKGSSIKPIVFKGFQLKDSVADNDVYLGDANDLVKAVSGDILYLDPPYNQRQYSGDYHLLNTIAQNDKPEIAGITGKRVGRVGSPWSSKKKVEDEFRTLVESANFEFLVMSYSNESLMPSELVGDIMSANGKYSVHEMEHKRFSSKKGQKNAEGGETVTEYLHVLHKAG
ncbi:MULTISPECIES: DNA adenine methylase [Pseudomonas]|uniref:site-specific DNA-methyltransferase (adenine-specific) n=2 Tax=Pseudomonas TaxID=286 RepID=A0A267AQZ9_PSEFR|nr:MULTISPECIES: DNA adenine methylase [Pseudomonas]MQT24818.1 DNA methyltransferase [Pseudomonas helleri]PAA14309.1 DNA methyltransferase [Pseudomonas fragi]UHC79817.1 DNA adenine methylase [Pseudomonas sp. NIBR-H-19]